MMRQFNVIVTMVPLALRLCACNGEPPAADEQDAPFIPPPLSDTSTASAAPLMADGHYLRDARGGVVLLRGVNVAGNSKVPPFRGISDASELDPLPRLGFNAIRLLFLWEGFEPAPGQEDADYLSWYTDVVGWAADRDLFVLVDFHQDAYSRYSHDGCGDGFPDWAVPQEVPLASPRNDDSCVSWGSDMLTSATLADTWRLFHADTHGAKTAYLNMVDTVVRALIPHDNVIGFEVMNEPWGTDEELGALIADVSETIRNADPDALVFLPAHALVSGGVLSDTVEWPALPGLVYSPHYYNGGVLLSGIWSGADPSLQLDRLLRKSEEGGVPMALSEFGAPAGTENGAGYIGAQLDWLDAHFVSSMQWNFTPGWNADTKDGWNMEDLSMVDDMGNLRDNAVVRPYPRRIGGAPVSFLVDESGFALEWDNRDGLEETVVFVPEGFASGHSPSLLTEGSVAGACRVDETALVCDLTGNGRATVAFR